MKVRHCAGPMLIAIALLCAAQTIPVHSDIGYDGGNSTNRIGLMWEAVPGKLYNVLTTTSLVQQPWQALNPSALYASNNLVRFRDTNSLPVRFYKIVKLDTDPPEIWRLAPASNAIAVGRQSPLQAYLRDETAIDPASIALAVGTNSPVTLADPRLSFTNGLLTYAPTTNQFLGTDGQMVTNRLIVTDTLGHRATNLWSFQLKQTPVLASNVVLVGTGPGTSSNLTLISTNGGTYLFSYTGASSGLTNGQLLISTDPNAPYKRRILSLTDDPAGHTVSLVTTQASLAEFLQKGSLRLVGDFSEQSAGASLPLAGTIIFDNGVIREEVTSGQITFNPDFTVSGTFDGGRLTAFDLDISGSLGLDMVLQANIQSISGDLDGSRPFTTPRRTVRLLGLIGLVPVWVEAVLEFNIGYEAHLEAIGTATWGFESSRTLTLGATLRNGQWSYYALQPASSFNPFTPGWQINGAATVKGYVEPRLTLYLENLAGPSTDLKPYLELEGKACVQPGQAGVDVSLYAGLNSTLAIDVRGWDSQWGTLPSWEIFNLRTIPPLSHKNLTTAVGQRPQTFSNMVWISCGTFTMGSPASEPGRNPNEGPQTRVTISHGFWMGQYEVTQGEYLAMMGTNPSYFTATNGYGTDLNRPVEQVSRSGAVAYCTALTTRERNTGRLPAGYVYRLPTEAEWEYACRAGTTTPFHYGNELRSGMANFQGQYEYVFADPHHSNPSGTYLARTTTVGSYAPNAWGLYDMHGNVWEWCSDWWSPSLPGGNVTDPQGPPTGTYRVIRGGCWGCYAWDCRSANRYYNPDFRYNYVGIRVVLAPGQ